jgi:hypothetical protein
MMDSTIFSDIYLDLDLVREIKIEIFGFGFGFGERNSFHFHHTLISPQYWFKFNDFN